MARRLLGRLQSRFRKSRYRRLEEELGLRQVAGLILDLGGGPASFFSARYPFPERIVLVERVPALAQQARDRVPQIKAVVADGLCLPFRNGCIAATVCNSVIEHVADAGALAEEIQRVSSAYFVQTPNGRFPLEMHAEVPIPFYRWLPCAPFRRLICWLFRGDFNYVESVRYLSADELARLFPAARIDRERFLGLTKSLYAVRLTGQAPRREE
jgi:SAM-dependent methyltransferase